MVSLYIAAFILSLFLSALSNVLLKKSSGEKKKKFIYEYINLKVISAYLIYFSVVLLLIYAYTGIEYKLGTILGTLSYMILMICGRIFFNEKITFKRIAGNCVIILGIIIFSLGM